VGRSGPSLPLSLPPLSLSLPPSASLFACPRYLIPPFLAPSDSSIDSERSAPLKATGSLCFPVPRSRLSLDCTLSFSSLPSLPLLHSVSPSPAEEERPLLLHPSRSLPLSLPLLRSSSHRLSLPLYLSISLFPPPLSLSHTHLARSLAPHSSTHAHTYTRCCSLSPPLSPSPLLAPHRPTAAAHTLVPARRRPADLEKAATVGYHLIF
jgi:hypothetical protein